MDPPILNEGQILADKYRVLRLIGRGGMAEVYAAHHEILHQTVALKVLLPAVAAIPGAASRFLNEARAAARIRSEHVAAVMDVGMREDGSAYIVLEYLEGEDLQQVVDRRGPLPSSEAVDYVLQALEALAHAHSLGIVHRDLKPSNIFLARAAGGVTVVKVFDFGISKAPKIGDGADQSTTASQVILGTPSYMSPEQARSARDVDARADIWALGVILYRLLTGALPFVADNIADMLTAILVHPHASMRSVRPELSLELESIVARCLGKERSARFGSVAELAQALGPHATLAGRTSVDRISRTLGISSSKKPFESEKTDAILAPSELALTPIPGASPAVAAATKLEARTDSGWMEASAIKSQKASRLRRWGAVGAGTLAALVAGLFALRAPRGAPEPAAIVVKEPAPPPPRAGALLVPLPSVDVPPLVDAAARTSEVAPPTPPVAPSAAAPSVAHPPVATRSPPPAPAAPPSAHPGKPAPRPTPTASAAPTSYDVLDQRN